jgi:hypothetical protein
VAKISDISVHSSNSLSLSLSLSLRVTLNCLPFALLNQKVLLNQTKKVSDLAFFPKKKEREREREREREKIRNAWALLG